MKHTRHRSSQNFLVYLLAGIAAYGRQAKKPSLNLGGRGSLLSPSYNPKFRLIEEARLFSPLAVSLREEERLFLGTVS